MLTYFSSSYKSHAVIDHFLCSNVRRSSFRTCRECQRCFFPLDEGSMHLKYLTSGVSRHIGLNRAVHHV